MVAAMVASSMVSKPSASTVRPQSMVSATDGSFLSCMPRSTPMMRTSSSAMWPGSSGTRDKQDSAFQVGAGEVDVQEQAATLERLGQLAGGVGGQHDERRPLGGDGAQLGDRHGEVGQHLQQQTLDFDVGLVGLVDQQHGGFGAPDRGQQRTGEQKFLGEDVGLGLVPVIGAGLDTQNLLGMTPLVERTRLVDALVALQADQFRSGRPAATARASSVSTDTGRPSTSSGLPSRSARKTAVAVAVSAG